MADTIRCRKKPPAPLLDGEAPAGWDTIVRVQKMYFDPPDIDGRMPRVSKWEVIRPYSITSSARASSVGGISKPSALAVLRLITNSNLVGNWTGKSCGFPPFKIRST